MYIIIYKEYGVGHKAIPKEKKFSKKVGESSHKIGTKKSGESSHKLELKKAVFPASKLELKKGGLEAKL